MNIRKGLVTGCVLLASTFTLAEESACESHKTDMVSLYYMTAMAPDADIGAYYQSKIDLIDQLAAKYEWVDYQMTSQDVSVNNSSYGTDVFEVSVSVSFQFKADYKAISQVAKEAGAYSVSASRYDEQVCPDDYSY